MLGRLWSKVQPGSRNCMPRESSRASRACSRYSSWAAASWSRSISTPRPGASVTATAVDDLQRLDRQPLHALQPDPVRVERVVLAGGRRAAVSDHGQGDVEVVVGVAAPREARVVAELGHAYGASHRPEVRVGQRDAHRLEQQRARHLPPVGGDHVRRRGQPGRPPELGEDLASREPVLRAARVLRVRQRADQRRAQPDGLGQRPGTVRVEGDPGVREQLLQRPYGKTSSSPLNTPPLSLKSRKPYFA